MARTLTIRAPRLSDIVMTMHATLEAIEYKQDLTDLPDGVTLEGEDPLYIDLPVVFATPETCELGYNHLRALALAGQHKVGAVNYVTERSPSRLMVSMKTPHDYEAIKILTNLLREIGIAPRAIGWIPK